MGKISGKLFDALTLNSKDVKGRRAEILVEKVKREQEDLISQLERDNTDLETTLLGLTDFGPETEHDLRVGGKNFNARNWVARMQTVQIALKTKAIELEVARATYADWFA